MKLSIYSKISAGGGGSRSTLTTLDYLLKEKQDVKLVSTIKELIEDIDKRDPDLILHHNIKGMIKVWNLCKKRKKPLIITLNNDITCINSVHIKCHDKQEMKGIPCLKCNFFNALKCNLIDWRTPFLQRIKNTLSVPYRYFYLYKNRLKTIQEANGVICIGEGGKKRLELAGIKRKIYVCPQPIDDSFLEKEEIIKRNVKNTKIIFMSRTHFNTGSQLALKAFENINDKSIKLLAIGPYKKGKRYFDNKTEGKYFSKYVNNKNIAGLEFTGYVFKDKIKELYKKARITLVPLIEFSMFGRTWAESICLGTPVISFKGRGAANDYLKHNETAYFIDYDVDELKNAMVKLINDEELWMKLRINGWKYAKENVIASVVVKRLEKIYNEVLEKAKNDNKSD